MFLCWVWSNGKYATSFDKIYNLIAIVFMKNA